MKASTNEKIAALAAALLDKYQNCERIVHIDADTDAKPLIEAMHEAGLFSPGTTHHYVEWEGVLEFGVVPVFWGADEDTNNCTNVSRDGSVETFMFNG